MATLRAAAGEVDLDPPLGCWLSGFAARVSPSPGRHDPVMARAVLLEDGGAVLAIVSCDLIGFTTGAIGRLRERIAAASGGLIAPNRVLIACTHTHSGPASMPFRGVMGRVDGCWLQTAMRRIVDLVAGLAGRLAPARIGFASVTADGIGYNRQDPSQPIDDRLGVIGLDGADGSAIATLANYATHAVVLGPDNLQVSADYPGEVARRLSESRGGVGLFLQGACGDADPVVYRDRGWGRGTFEDVRAMGARLADQALVALRGAVWSGDPGIRVANEILAVPLDPAPSDGELASLAAGFEADRRAARERRDGRADELIAEAMLDWVADVREAALRGTATATLPSELFVAAIADARIIAVPFETYSGISRAIARALRPRTSYFCGYANGVYGYCPTRWAKEQGGYGPDGSSRWFPQLLSPIGYGAEELIVQRARALARA